MLPPSKRWIDQPWGPELLNSEENIKWSPFNIPPPPITLLVYGDKMRFLLHLFRSGVLNHYLEYYRVIANLSGDSKQFYKLQYLINPQGKSRAPKNQKFECDQNSICNIDRNFKKFSKFVKVKSLLLLAQILATIYYCQLHNCVHIISLVFSPCFVQLSLHWKVEGTPTVVLEPFCVTWIIQ